jgi:hypothetical protein
MLMLLRSKKLSNRLSLINSFLLTYKYWSYKYTDILLKIGVGKTKVKFVENV